MALIYEEKIPQGERKAFTDKVKRIADDLEINPNWLMAVMNFESGLRADIVNSIGATGLIQFMPNTAKSLGTTTSELAKMSRVKQLDYVYKYYNQSWIRPKLLRYVDLYMATIFPASMGKPDNHVIKSDTISANKFTQNNPIFDREGNKDGITTVGEINKAKLSRIPSEWRENFMGEMDTISKKFRRYYGVQIVLILVVLTAIAYLIYLKRNSLLSIIK
jgi:hypothetical protein